MYVAPIELAILERAKLNMLRIKPLLGNIGNWIPKTKIYRHMKVLASSLEGVPAPGDVTTPARLAENFTTDIASRNPQRADFEVYTDGSLSVNGAGAGVCILYQRGKPTLTVSERLERTTVFMTEGIHSGASVQGLGGTMSKDIRIMSDNQAAIRANSATVSNNPWVIQAAEALNTLGK